jgi:lactate racemase
MMDERQVQVPFGDETLTIDLAPGWRLTGVCKPADVPAHPDPLGACREALAQPLGMPALNELARGKKKIAIVVEDVARPTPVAEFFEPIIDALEAAKVPPEAVTMITALGVHRPMTEAEMAAKVGPRAMQTYRWINHNFEPGDHLDHLGKTTHGTPVFINKEVSRADLVIGVGCIEPHVIASFGGGAKILVPGVAGQETVAKTHRRNTTPATFNNVGLNPDENPMRCDLEECVDMIAPPIFVVDAVLRGDLTVARIVAGDRKQVYKEGIKTAAEIFGAKIPARADVVIASSHPMNVDMRQGAKALANTIRALKPGGTLICLLKAEEGVGDFPAPKSRLPISKGMLKKLSHVLLPLLRFSTLGMQEEAHFFTYFTLQAVKDYNVVFYGPNIPPAFRERLPFYEIHPTLEGALASAATATPTGDVLVFPNGGVTYPIL